MKHALFILLLLGVMSIAPHIASAQIPDADCLCFTASVARSTVQLVRTGQPYEAQLEYRINGSVDWQPYDFAPAPVIMLNRLGDHVYFRNAASETDVAGFSKDFNNYYHFEMSGSIAASGNVMSLVGSDDLPSAYCFTRLFADCTGLTSAPELPATTLATDCYNGMFSGCTGLATAPELPAAALAEGCYRKMFEGCTSLSKVQVGFSEWGQYQEATSDWLYNTAAEGVFICPEALDKSQTGTDYIPEGWTAVFEAKANKDPDSAHYYTTFYSRNNAYRVPSDVTAYTGVVDGSVLLLTPIAGNIIPADEAVVLKATRAQLNLPYTTATAPKSAANVLTGTDTAMTLGAGDYALSLGQNGVGFYLWDGKPIAAHKAYLTQNGTNKVNAFTLKFDDAPTAIDLPTRHVQPATNAYNLYGQRVGHGYKGIVIENGTKMYCK